MDLVVPDLIKKIVAHYRNIFMKDSIVNFLKTYLKDKSAIIGLSGGIDSSVVAYLLAEAIGSDKVYGISMPSSTNASVDETHAEQVAKHLGIHFQTIPIEPIIKVYHNSASYFKNSLAAANVKARIRMTLLYGQANVIDGLVVGTGNKSELAVGYFTKYGDGGVDLLPLGSLYKFQVRLLAAELGIPADIITKPPTAGLSTGQTDERELGMSYEVLDAILQAIEHNTSLEGFSPETVTRVKGLKAKAAHKLDLPPIAPVV